MPSATNDKAPRDDLPRHVRGPRTNLIAKRTQRTGRIFPIVRGPAMTTACARYRAGSPRLRRCLWTARCSMTARPRMSITQLTRTTPTDKNGAERCALSVALKREVRRMIIVVLRLSDNTPICGDGSGGASLGPLADPVARIVTSLVHPVACARKSFFQQRKPAVQRVKKGV